MDGVAGGVERMATAMMNEMVARGHRVSLLTWDKVGAKPYFAMDNTIKWHCLDIGDPAQKVGWWTRFKRMSKLRGIIQTDRPDIILAFESGVFLSIRLFLAGYNIPMIAAERNAPSRHEFSGNKYKKHVVFNSLRLADKITVQFERYREGYPSFLRSKIVCIHNPVKPIIAGVAPSAEVNSIKTILCVARPTYQKNIDVLIKAFAEALVRFPSWQLLIAGDGEDIPKLKLLAEELGINRKVNFLGSVKNTAENYSKADIFCLPSRYEGFPNALAEAMSHGLPSVGFQGCFGVADLIENGKTGLLADGNDNAVSLAQKLELLMGNEPMRNAMGQAARTEIERYNPATVFDQWEKLFTDMVKK